MTDPGIVVNTLEAISNDMAERQNEYETAARNRARLVRDWEKSLATARRTANGSDADTRKAVALLTAIEKDDTYMNLQQAEGEFEAMKVVMKVLETRAMIGMAILRSQSRA
jgi:hypothetical protein